MKQIFLALGIILMAAPVWSNPAATKAINDVRAGRSLPAVSYSKALEKAAAIHMQDMVRTGNRSHTGSNGSTVGTRVKRAGYKFCFAAENIAWGQRSLASVMQEWTNSPSHYKNMVNRKAREFALVRGEGNVWVMVLGTKRGRC